MPEGIFNLWQSEYAITMGYLGYGFFHDFNFYLTHS